MTSLNVVCILQGDLFLFKLWFIYFFLLIRRVRLTFGIYILCQDNKQGGRGETAWCPNVCHYSVPWWFSLPNGGVTACFSTLGWSCFSLFVFISTLLYLWTLAAQPKSLKCPAQARPLLMSLFTITVWPSTYSSFFLLNFYFHFSKWLFFFKSKAPLKTECVFSAGHVTLGRIHHSVGSHFLSCLLIPIFHDSGWASIRIRGCLQVLSHVLGMQKLSAYRPFLNTFP